MALTFATVKIINPANERKQARIRCMVDSGAVYSVIPKDVLKRLGIKARSERTFTLANGEEVRRAIGDAIFEYAGERGASPVIFGERGDSTLLGAVTLEALGLVLDPLRREIKQLPLVLGGMRRPR